jgi:hypothetical protein
VTGGERTPFKFMKKIKLTNGMIAKIDDEDFEKVSAYNWNYKDTGYARTTSRPHILMHHFIMGKIEGKVIDHIDRDKLNNQKSNLRFCSQSQNSINKDKKKKCSSKYKGVIWKERLGKWECRIKKNKKLYYLGLFENEIEAALQYNKKAIELYGEFAFLNDV